jgi:hypothetical protein
MNILKFEDYVNEGVRNDRLLDLGDLAEAITTSNPGWDIYIVYDMITKTFKTNGDEGVMQMFKEATGITIEPIIKGRYIYA